jgi:hypothetical protein
MIAYNIYICEACTSKAVCYTIITFIRRKQKLNSTLRLKIKIVKKKIKKNNSDNQ